MRKLLFYITVFYSLQVSVSFAADHRDAPLIQEDAAADIGDVYAFRNPLDSDKLVLIMTVNPLSAPEESITYNFSPTVRYRFNIDNDGDSKAEHKISVRFKPTVPGPQRFTARFSNGTIVRGDATAPSIEPFANTPVITEGPDGIRIFAGQSDDPFFFDIVGFFRFLAGTGGFSGADSFAGTNVSSIVIELPLDMVAENGDTLDIWADTARKSLTRLRYNKRRNIIRNTSGRFQQLDREGNPAIATLVPASLKDSFNAGVPKNDADDFAATIVATLESLGTNETNIGILASVAVPDTLTLDLSSPDGFPNGRRLEDDVIDTVLSLILNGPASDNVSANDMVFSTSFPYVALPHQAP